jgi:hypothetical protein
MSGAGINNVRDLTMRQKACGGGMNHDTLFLCGHKTHRQGATYRRPGGGGQLWVRCGACNEKRKAA